MNLEKLIPFFADSPVNDAFDDVMQELQIKSRPKGPDATVFVRTPDEQLALEFAANVSFKEDRTMPAKSDEAYLLAGFDAYAGAPHKLPFGLFWDMDIAKVRAALGESRKAKNHNATFFHSGLRVTCRFEDDAMSKLKSIGITVIDIHAKELYNL
ncbi:hypothetical protein [Roseateles amylovorans]|uniref:Uncharacterized protein n=1 Tax=Roseateles amylovorans TaxID=2978473 RepID=A0ABY6B6T7_9BURK|nr:hypothetical protein [Roseateles amylovorans]UXH80644.1 hypothetical protein N4261_12515 [Roseateles amylovorans]